MSLDTPKTPISAPRTFTIREFLAHVFPMYETGQRPLWPPDAFGIAAALLKRSGAYTKIVQKWPPGPEALSTDQWSTLIGAIAQDWKDHYLNNGEWAPEIEACWQELLRNSDLEVADISREPHVIVALTKIVAVADEACVGFGFRDTNPLEHLATKRLEGRKTLCDTIDPSFLMVLPKSHNPVTGMTLRSLTHNLALWDNPEVVPEWCNVNLGDDTGNLNILLVPWPLNTLPRAFSTCEPDNYRMPTDFGFFSYKMPRAKVNVRRLKALFDQASDLVGKIDAVVFPELSLSSADFKAVRRKLPKVLLVAGIGKSGSPTTHGTNEVAIGDPDSMVATHLQAKHHRWRLDWGQINQYGVGAAFSGHKYWWEAIMIDKRAFTVLVCGKTTPAPVDGPLITVAVLLCEDLARQDPVAALVRTIGPSLVIALLMDGPQLPERWSARYATVLSEDPRSSVLTLTAAGMVDLAQAQRRASEVGPRSIALWRDAFSGQARPIVLEQGAEAVAISLTSRKRTEYSADGRPAAEHYLELRGIHQVHPPATPEPPSGRPSVRQKTAEIKGKERGI